MARVRDQEVRRRQLVAATERAIVERGLARLRIKDIATAAGMSPALVSYYFPSIEQLLVEVHRSATDRFYWTRRRQIETLDSSRDQLATLVWLGVPRAEDDFTSQALNEFHIEAARTARHAQLMVALNEQEVLLYRRAVERGAALGELKPRAEPQEIAVTVVGLEDAIGLHGMAKNPTYSSQAGRELLLGYLELACGIALPRWTVAEFECGVHHDSRE